MSYHVGAEGPLDSRLAIVAEKGAWDETKYNRPMVGTTGSMIRRHARRAGVDAGTGYWPKKFDASGNITNAKDLGHPATQVWLTNAVHDFPDPSANPTSGDLIREQERLYRELANLPNLNCVLAVGAHALASLTNFRFADILNRRGSRIRSAMGTKLVASLHPSFYTRGEWRYESVTQFDFNRAVIESHTSDLVYMPRDYYIAPNSIQEALQWMGEIKNRPLSDFISFDIETFQGRGGTWYVSCIAFSDHPQRAYCIPIMTRNRRPYWPELSAEAAIWHGIQDLLAIPNRRYVTQNGHAFDSWQLYKHHIETPFMGTGFDTFSAHSLLAPDLPHDLGFLVSIYTDEPYYKDESGRAEEFGAVSNEQFWIYNCKDAACTLEVAYGLIADLAEARMWASGVPTWKPFQTRIAA